MVLHWIIVSMEWPKGPPAKMGRRTAARRKGTSDSAEEQKNHVRASHWIRVMHIDLYIIYI